MHVVRERTCDNENEEVVEKKMLNKEEEVISLKENKKRLRSCMLYVTHEFTNNREGRTEKETPRKEKRKESAC